MMDIEAAWETDSQKPDDAQSTISSSTLHDESNNNVPAQGLIRSPSGSQRRSKKKRSIAGTPSPGALNYRGMNIYQAAAQGNLPLCVLLWGMASAKRVNLLAPDAQGNNPMHMAALADTPETVGFFIQQTRGYLTEDTKLVESRNHVGETPLLKAMSRGIIPVAKTLIDEGSDPLATDYQGNSCFTILAKAGHIWCLNFMYHTICTMHGSQVALELLSALDNEAHSAFDWAADSGNVNILEFLIRKGLNPYRTDPYNRSALFWAVKANRIEAARFLVLCGCDPYQADNTNISPYQLAQQSKQVIMIQVLELTSHHTNHNKTNNNNNNNNNTTNNSWSHRISQFFTTNTCNRRYSYAATSCSSNIIINSSSSSGKSSNSNNNNNNSGPSSPTATNMNITHSHSGGNIHMLSPHPPLMTTTATTMDSTSTNNLPCSTPSHDLLTTNTSISSTSNNSNNSTNSSSQPTTEDPNTTNNTTPATITYSYEHPSNRNNSILITDSNIINITSSSNNNNKKKHKLSNAIYRQHITCLHTATGISLMVFFIWILAIFVPFYVWVGFMLLIVYYLRKLMQSMTDDPTTSAVYLSSNFDHYYQYYQQQQQQQQQQQVLQQQQQQQLLIQQQQSQQQQHNHQFPSSSPPPYFPLYPPPVTQQSFLSTYCQSNTLTYVFIFFQYYYYKTLYRILQAPEKGLGIWGGSILFYAVYLYTCYYRTMDNYIADTNSVASNPHNDHHGNYNYRDSVERLSNAEYQNPFHLAAVNGAERMPIFYWLVVGLFAAAVVSWTVFTLTDMDPGYINTREYDFEEVLAQSLLVHGSPPRESYCKTTMVKKPLRSKYCSRAGIVVARMDHYCLWLNMTIGFGNHRSFLFVVLTQFLASLSGVVLTIRALHMEIDSDDHYCSVIDGLLSRENFVVLLLAAFFVIASGFLVALLYVQIDNICNNITINERINRSRYSYLVDTNGNPRNRFDRGIITNILEFLRFPGYDVDYMNIFILPPELTQENMRINNAKHTGHTQGQGNGHQGQGQAYHHPGHNQGHPGYGQGQGTAHLHRLFPQQQLHSGPPSVDFDHTNTNTGTGIPYHFQQQQQLQQQMLLQQQIQQHSHHAQQQHTAGHFHNNNNTSTKSRANSIDSSDTAHGIELI